VIDNDVKDRMFCLAKSSLGRSADFLHSGTGYIENSRVRCIIDFLPMSEFFGERALLVLKNSITISITKIGTVEPVTLKKAVFVPYTFQTRFQSRFSA